MRETTSSSPDELSPTKTRSSYEAGIISDSYVCRRRLAHLGRGFAKKSSSYLVLAAYDDFSPNESLRLPSDDLRADWELFSVS